MFNTNHLPQRNRDFVGVILVTLMAGRLPDERQDAIYDEILGAFDEASAALVLDFVEMALELRNVTSSAK